MNTFGRNFRLTTFGESHGPAVGGVIDGMPSGITVDFELVRSVLAQRSPATAAGSTSRREPDEVEYLSGIYNGKTLGTPIAFVVRNKAARSEDYETMANLLRPNHADFTYRAKYGHVDPRGGGRASARETVARVVAGAFAQMILRESDIDVTAWTAQIGRVRYEHTEDASLPTQAEIYANATRCPDGKVDAEMECEIDCARKDCDSLGGVVECVITGVPVGLGEPLADKFQASLAAAMMSIPAARGFEYGDGFAAASMRGSESIDEFYCEDGKIKTRTNHSGGIQGGITNGMPVKFRVAFKPIATMPDRTVRTSTPDGNGVDATYSGRHDLCAVPRAVAVVRAMAALTVVDAMMSK